MQVRLLGPVDVTVSGAPQPVRGLRRKAVLAVLGLQPGQIVSADRLIEIVWEGQAPAAAANALQSHVSHLRDVFGVRTAIAARSPGYVLDVPGEATDVESAERLIAAVRRVTGPAREAELLRSALDLWRGEALVDVCRLTWLDRQAERLAQLRHSTSVAWMRARLRVGEHLELVPELEHLTHRHPFDEQVHELLMLALHRCGRQADALSAFHRLRCALNEDLGVEPGAALRELQAAILRDDPVLSLVPMTVSVEHRFVPAQLPAEAAGFVGRADVFAHLDTLLARESDGVQMAAIGGPAGVGKTATAVHWAHRVCRRFPDGQLFIDLQGFDPQPLVQSGQALARFLRVLGVPAERVPLDEPEAAALYRSLLADRRVLIVLDNAADVSQIGPLIPGSRGCFVLVTSRVRLGGLAAGYGARLVNLDTLTPDEARMLLAGILGAQRLRDEPAAAAALAELCGRLPLALRIAAANLLTREHSSLATFVEDLRKGNRLARLRVDGDDRLAVRAAFELSYSALAPAEQRLFRLLGLVPGPDFGLAAAVALAGISPDTTRQLLSRLVCGYLLSEPDGERFCFHDLLREFAQSLVDSQDTPQSRREALDRWCAYYVRVTNAAARLVLPETLHLPSAGSDGPVNLPFADHAQALLWLDTERFNIVALIRHAAKDGPQDVAWRLADAMRGYFYMRHHLSEWLATARDGLCAAEADGDPAAQAAAHLSLGVAHNCAGAPDLAIAHLCSAQILAERAGWTEAQAATLNNLGTVSQRHGRPRDAARHYTQALRHYRDADDVARTATALYNLGMVRRELGQLKAANALHTRALALLRRIGRPLAQAPALTLLAEVHCDLGWFGSARTYLAQAHPLHERSGHRDKLAMTLCVTANLHRLTGQPHEALQHAHEALKLGREVANPRTQAHALLALGAAHHELGRHSLAAERFRSALELAAETGNLYCQAAALIGIAGADLAPDTVERALDMVRSAGYLLLEADALSTLARIHTVLGNVAEAADAASATLTIQRRTGYQARPDRGTSG